MNISLKDVRWMIRRDYNAVVAIDEANGDDPWSLDELIEHLSLSRVVGQVIMSHRETVGFTVFRVTKEEIEILKLVVHPACRRRGFGSTMLDKIVRFANRRNRRIMIDLRDLNLGGHLFARRLGFLAVGMTRRMFGDDDGYRFVLAQ